MSEQKSGLKAFVVIKQIRSMVKDARTITAQAVGGYVKDGCIVRFKSPKETMTVDRWGSMMARQTEPTWLMQWLNAFFDERGIAPHEVHIE